MRLALALFCRRGGLFVLVEVPCPGEEPHGRNAEVADEEREPRHLKNIPLGLFLQSVHVPAIDAVGAGEGLLAADLAVDLEAIQGLEEPLHDRLAFGCLHKKGG